MSQNLPPNGETEAFPDLTRRQKLGALLCVMLALSLSALSQTMIATTMPLIVADLGGFDRYAIAAMSYLVAAAITFLIVGQLSDIHGRRLFLLIGMAVFAVGSLLLGFCASITQVIVFRGMQGVGGGAILTCCLTAVADLIKPEKRIRVHSLLSAVYAMSFVVGPLVGGYLADLLSWQWSFLVVSAAGVLMLPLIARTYPKPIAAADEQELDVWGMATLLLALPPLFIALAIGGVQLPWTSPIIVGTLLFSCVMILAFIVVERRAASPLMPLEVYADPMIRVALGIMFLISIGLYGTILYLPLLFQVTYDYTATASGGMLVPFLLGMVIGGLIVGIFLSRAEAHYRSSALLCSGLATLGLFLMGLLSASTNVGWTQTYLVTAAVGIGGVIGTLSNSIQNHVRFAVVGTATSALHFFRMAGGVVGLAALGVVLTTQYATHIDESLSTTTKSALADAEFELTPQDANALLEDDAAYPRFDALVANHPEGAALVETMRDTVGVAMQAALDSVILVAALLALLAFGLAMFFRVKISDSTKGPTKPN